MSQNEAGRSRGGRQAQRGRGGRQAQRGRGGRSSSSGRGENVDPPAHSGPVSTNPRPRGGRTINDHRVPLRPADYARGVILAEWKSVELSKGGGEIQRKGEKVRKEGYELLASYNWLPGEEKGRTAAIVVPGHPAKWTPSSFPARVNPDTGLYYIDQNAYRNPSCPLEPLILSLFTLHPTYNLNPTDLITDRLNLRKLLRFVIADPRHMHDFKIFLQVVGTKKTVLLTRWETEAVGTVEGTPSGFRGFGKSFETEFTKYPKEVEGSTGHERVCRYTFAGMELMVRFTVDASSDDVTTVPAGEKASVVQTTASRLAPAGSGKSNVGTRVVSPTSDSAGTTEDTSGINKQQLRSKGDSTSNDKESANNETRTIASETSSDPLSSLLSSLSLAPASPTINAISPANPEPPLGNLQIIRNGSLLPQSHIIELKTRSDNPRNRTQLDLTDHVPQIYFSHTTNLYVGYHRNGVFSDVDTQRMSERELETWEENNQKALKGLGGLLREIVDTARKVDSGEAVLVCLKGVLRMHEIAEGEVCMGALPEDLKRMWGVGASIGSGE